MKQIELELHHHNFFCPVTGQQILDPESFNPSPAQLFCYIDSEGCFEFIHESIMDELKKFNLDIKNEIAYMGWDDFNDFISNSKLDNSIVVFSITNNGMACGPVSMTAHHCIDMDYYEEIDEDPIVDNLPSLSEIHDMLQRTNKSNPKKEGYAAYVRDSMGQGVFHFCNTDEEWTEFMPTLILSDNLGDLSYESAKNTNKFKAQTDIYYSYFKPFSNWTLGEYKEFMNFSNEVLEDYTIEFVGPVSELFNSTNEFSKERIDSFGKDPNENEAEYFSFLCEN